MSRWQIGVVVLVGMVCMLFQADGSWALEWAEALHVTGVSHAVSPEGETQEIVPGMRLYAGDVVRTGPEGRVRFLLPDDSLLDVHQDSELALNDVLEEEESGFSVSLFLGRLSMQINSLQARDMVVAPTMVIGVRGTVFDVGVAEDGSTLVGVSRGEVSVGADDAWSAQGTTLEPGREMVVFPSGETVESSIRFSGDEESFAAFRSERLDLVLERLPVMVNGVEERLETALQAYDRAVATVRESSDALLPSLDLVNQGAWLGGRERLEIHRHARAVFLGLSTCRVVGTRLAGMYRRGKRMNGVLLEMEDRGELDKSLAAARQAYEDILETEDDVMTRVRQGATDVRESVEPVRPVLRMVLEREREWRGENPWQQRDM